MCRVSFQCYRTSFISNFQLECFHRNIFICNFFQMFEKLHFWKSTIVHLILSKIFILLLSRWVKYCLVKSTQQHSYRMVVFCSKAGPARVESVSLTPVLLVFLGQDSRPHCTFDHKIIKKCHWVSV